jgi:hypothetical protein
LESSGELFPRGLGFFFFHGDYFRVVSGEYVAKAVRGDCGGYEGRDEERFCRS